MRSLLSLLALTALLPSAEARAPVALDGTISTVEQLVWDAESQALAQKHGLSLVNVTWEDTARSKGSAWGPNISDMTIGVRDSRDQLHPMPVLRFDNFTDETVDIDPERFLLSVGNEDGRALEAVSLREILEDTRSYLHDPSSWEGRTRGLWSGRDGGGVIVSAQAALLPVPREGTATFTPVIYNYQSSPDNPAVLTIVATREGTSVQVVENDEGYMSDVLYFNDDGQRAPFTAVRLSDHLAQGGGSGGAVAAGGADGGNVVLVVQVPLKQRQPERSWWGLGDMAMEEAAAPMAAPSSRATSDMEDAVVGHGPVEGPFTEIDGLEIERDERFPVRVTVQFYKATTTGRLTDADVREIRQQIDDVYGDPAYVSSLVTEGHTGRSTEWVSSPPESASWARPTWSWLKAF
ncbi:hypothetical protein L6R53_14250 [Myxococcota bacterium]|nr:hypothetical protein [Myxococcota bacterium]